MKEQIKPLLLEEAAIGLDISIAVIAKNEEKNIGYVLEEILHILKGVNFSSELFLVDGNSIDKTAYVAHKYGVRVVQAPGRKGSAVKLALSLAKGKYVIFIDADFSHMARDIPKLVNFVKENPCDMAIVSRILGRSEELGCFSWDSFLRFCGNKLSTMIINIRWNAKLTDIQNGFRIIKRGSFASIHLAEDGFAIEQEMVMKCLKANMRILEIAGVERKRCYGRSKIIKRIDFWGYLWSLLRNI